MSSKPSPGPKAEILMTGVAMGESPRWHENRLWFSDWGAQEILAVDSNGKSEVAARVPFGLPFCIDWLLDGRLLVVSGREGLLLRREARWLSRDPRRLALSCRHGLERNCCGRSRQRLYQRRLGNHSADVRWLASASGRQHRLPQRHGHNARQFDLDHRRVLRQEADRFRHRRRRKLVKPTRVGRPRRWRP